MALITTLATGPLLALIPRGTAARTEAVVLGADGGTTVTEYGPARPAVAGPAQVGPGRARSEEEPPG